MTIEITDELLEALAIDGRISECSPWLVEGMAKELIQHRKTIRNLASIVDQNRIVDGIKNKDRGRE